jgi:hypothetical protein
MTSFLSFLPLLWVFGIFMIIMWMRPPPRPNKSPAKISKADVVVNPAVSLENQSVGEMEVISALSALGLPAETIRSVTGTISTVSHLNTTIAALREDMFNEIRKQMPALASEYVKQRGCESQDKRAAQATAIVIAQLNTPAGVVHPAFSSIAAQLNAMRSSHWGKLKQAIEGELARADKTARNILSSDGRLATWGHFMEVTQPADGGLIKITRVEYKETFESSAKRLPGPYDGQSRPSSPLDAIIDAFDPCRTAEEAEFWLHVARARIARFVTKEDKTGGGFPRLEGNLLQWSRLLHSIESKIEPAWTKESSAVATEQAAPALAELPAQASSTD